MSRTYSAAEFGHFSGQRKGRLVRLNPLGLLSLLAGWQQRASDRIHLGQLSERELADVGLTHADLAQEIQKPFWRA